MSFYINLDVHVHLIYIFGMYVGFNLGLRELSAEYRFSGFDCILFLKKGK